MRDILLFGFPVFLFAILLAIIFRLREIDKRDRGLDLMRRYVSQHQALMERSASDMKQNMVTAEEVVSEKYRELVDLSQGIDLRLKDLSDHAGDLNELHQVMLSYHEALSRLSELTEVAHRRIVDADTRMKTFDDLESRVDEFQKHTTLVFESLESKKQELLAWADVCRSGLETEANAMASNIRDACDAYFAQAATRFDRIFSIMTDTVKSALVEVDKQMAGADDLVVLLSKLSSQSIHEIESHLLSAKEILEDQEVSAKEFREKRQSLGDEIATLEKSRADLEVVLADLQLNVTEIHTEQSLLDDELERKRALHQQLDAELASKQLVSAELDAALKLMQSAVEEEERKALLKKISIDEHGDDPFAHDAGLEPDSDEDSYEDSDMEHDGIHRQRIEHGTVPTEIEDEEVVLEL